MCCVNSPVPTSTSINAGDDPEQHILDLQTLITAAATDPPSPTHINPPSLFPPPEVSIPTGHILRRTWGPDMTGSFVWSEKSVVVA